jgi:hypothetical protein
MCPSSPLSLGGDILALSGLLSTGIVMSRICYEAAGFKAPARKNGQAGIFRKCRVRKRALASQKLRPGRRSYHFAVPAALAQAAAGSVSISRTINRHGIWLIKTGIQYDVSDLEPSYLPMVRTSPDIGTSIAQVHSVNWLGVPVLSDASVCAMLALEVGPNSWRPEPFDDAF